MGNYRCYLCNKEFWRESSLEKHLENKECPRLKQDMEIEINTPEGNQRSDAVFNIIDILIKQNKNGMSGNITHKDSNTVWEYQITKVMESN